VNAFPSFILDIFDLALTCHSATPFQSTRNQSFLELCQVRSLAYSKATTLPMIHPIRTLDGKSSNYMDYQAFHAPTPE
jgi:hypothetical protein